MDIKNARSLFIIDGIGALLSAFLLGIVLVKYEWYFGIPKNTLYLLASIPCVFAFYDFYCYFMVEKKLNLYVKGIAVANILYCCLSIGFAFYHAASLTTLGWSYIVVEIVVVLFLVRIELNVANKKRN